LVSLRSSAAQTAVLTIGPGVAAHVFVNGRANGAVAQDAPKRSVRVMLHKGANRILFRFTNKAAQVAALPVTVMVMPKPAWQTLPGD
jgi:hypothetical protein